MGSLFVRLSKAFDVAFPEGGHEPSNHGSKHIFSEPFKLVCACLGGTRGEGNGQRFSHNGSKLFDSDGEGRRVDPSGALFGRFDGHRRVSGRGRHALVVAAGIIVVWAIVEATVEPMLNSVFSVGCDG